VKLKIVQAGDPVLRGPAREVTVDELHSAAFRELIEFMRETMQDAPGVGLAAPQVGLPMRVAVIEDREEYHRAIDPAEMAARARRSVPFHVIVNPRIIVGSELVEHFEGCLSVAGFTAIVPRATRVTVECWNEAGETVRIEAEGWYARILQHEIDHLDGTLYIDRMKTRTFTTLENYRRNKLGV
jgi:peptide deformylase